MENHVISAIRPETQALAEYALQNIHVDDVLTFEQMAAVTKESPEVAARLFRTVMKLTARRENFFWSSVRGVGYRRINSVAAVESTRDRFNKAHRHGYRAREDLERVDTTDFSRDQHLSHASKMVIADMICKASHLNAEKRVAQTLRNSEASLNDRDMILAGLGLA